ncbi:hypothetical protein L537_2777, partial [Bordetella hinzii 1277]
GRPAKPAGPKAAGKNPARAKNAAKPAGGNKSRSRRGGEGRGDDWQPKGAAAHESRLGFLGGRGGRGDR